MEPAEDLVFNADRSRACAIAPFGIACYVRTAVADEHVTYEHRGVVETQEEAEQWLRGETPEKLIRIFDTA